MPSICSAQRMEEAILGVFYLLSCLYCAQCVSGQWKWLWSTNYTFFSHSSTLLNCSVTFEYLILLSCHTLYCSLKLILFTEPFSYTLICNPCFFIQKYLTIKEVQNNRFRSKGSLVPCTDTFLLNGSQSRGHKVPPPSFCHHGRISALNSLKPTQ